MLGTRNVELHDFAGVASVVEGNEQTRAVAIDAEKLRPDRRIGNSEGGEVVDRGRDAFFRVEQIQLVVRHAGGKSTLLRVAGNETHVDGAGGTGGVANHNFLRDGSLLE